MITYTGEKEKTKYRMKNNGTNVRKGMMEPNKEQHNQIEKREQKKNGNNLAFD